AALTGLGATIAAMASSPTSPPVAFIAHLGDSRAYRLHAGTLTQLTRDHTLVALLLESGLINYAPHRSYPNQHVLVKGLGMGLDITAEVTSIPLTDDDGLISCSDGI